MSESGEHEEKYPAPSPEVSAAMSLASLLPGFGTHPARVLPSVHASTARSASAPSAASDHATHREGRTRSRSAERTPQGKTAPRVAADTPSKNRKRCKQEPSELAPRIAELEREIAAVKSELEAPAAPALAESRQLMAECLEMKQRTTFLTKKLTEHSHWLQRVSSLMESAPLLEIACALSASDDRQEETSSARPATSTLRPGSEVHTPSSREESVLTLGLLDDWRRSPSREPRSRFILKERLKAVVDRSAERASSLVQNYGLAPQALTLFPLQIDSRGWHLATGVMINTSIAFRCERVLPAPSASRARAVAAELWQAVMRDEVQRTFFPIIQDSALAYQDEDYCLWHHMLQFVTNAVGRPVATVGSLHLLPDDHEPKRDEWQIAIEAVQDSYLYTFAADAAGDNGNNGLSPHSGSPPSDSTSPLSALNLGPSIRKRGVTNNFAIGLRVTETNAGVRLLLVGSAVFDLQHTQDPALELLQYLVSYLPIFEDLYLQQFATP